jgi:hypothetical protein
MESASSSVFDRSPRAFPAGSSKSIASRQARTFFNFFSSRFLSAGLFYPLLPCFFKVPDPFIPAVPLQVCPLSGIIREKQAGRRLSMSQPVRVAVLSDTHGMLRREVVAALQDCTHILHAGDIIRESDLDELRLYGSIYAVRGNNDRWLEGLGSLAGILRFSIAGVSFLMTHDPWDVPRNLEGVQVVVCGHTHRYREEIIDGRLWLNPGSCGRARFGGDVTMAKLLLQDGKILSVQRIDFE